MAFPASPDYSAKRYAPHLQCRLDIYKNPVQDSGGNACLMIWHGGAWNSNDRFLCTVPTAKGYGLAYHLTNVASSSGVHWDVVSVDYRMSAYGTPTPGYSAARTSGPVWFPGPFEDVASSVQWLKDNASTYGINAAKICGMGTSAGATMALVTALRRSAPWDRTTWTPTRARYKSSSSLPVVVNYIGAIDLRTIAGVDQIVWSNLTGLFQAATQAEFQAIPDKVKAAASPLAYLQSGTIEAQPAGVYSVYIQTVGGGTHPYVDPHDSQQAVDLDTALDAVEIDHTYEVVTDNWDDVALASSALLSERVKTFMEARLPS